MMLTPTSIPALLEDLEKFAAEVNEAIRAADLDWSERPDPASWCLAEVICHLRDVEREIHQDRFQAILARKNPFITGVSSDEWAESRDYRRQDGLEALEAFLAERNKTISLLRGLDEADWKRLGTHAFFGPTSLVELVNLAVKHDQAHWTQIQELLAA